jgi:hypothetical protein
MMERPTLEISIKELAQKAAKRALEKEGIYAAAGFLVNAYNDDPVFRDSAIASVYSAIKESSTKLSEKECAELARKVSDRFFGAEG